MCAFYFTNDPLFGFLARGLTLSLEGGAPRAVVAFCCMLRKLGDRVFKQPPGIQVSKKQNVSFLLIR